MHDVHKEVMQCMLTFFTIQLIVLMYIEYDMMKTSMFSYVSTGLETEESLAMR